MGGLTSRLHYNIIIEHLVLQDIILQADVGTKNISRSSHTYTEVYQQLKKQVNTKIVHY